jgi:hypothetical protein
MCDGSRWHRRLANDAREQSSGNDASGTQHSDMQATLAPTTLAEVLRPIYSRLEALPLELVNAVLATIVYTSDLFALGCALPRLWPYVSRHVEEVFLKRQLGVWAETAIAILSQEPSYDDGIPDCEGYYPAGLLTTADVAEMLLGISANEDKHWGPSHPAIVPAELHDVAHARYHRPFNRSVHFPGLATRLRRTCRLRGLLKQMDHGRHEGRGDGG